MLLSIFPFNVFRQGVSGPFSVPFSYINIVFYTADAKKQQHHDAIYIYIYLIFDHLSLEAHTIRNLILVFDLIHYARYNDRYDVVKVVAAPTPVDWSGAIFGKTMHTQTVLGRR